MDFNQWSVAIKWGGFPYQESVAGGGFFIGGLAGSFESGFALGARSLEQVKVVTGRAANGAYITESRNAVSLANKSAYVRATSTANVLKIGGRIVGGGVVTYNGLNLLANGGTDRQVAQFVTQSIITGVGFLDPIGFGVSLGLTAIEMAGGFDFIIGMRPYYTL